MNDDTMVRFVKLETVVGQLADGARERAERLIRLEASVSMIIEESRTDRAELLPKIRAVLESRSGEAERDITFRKDIDAAFSEIRTLKARLISLEKWQWMMLGGWAVIQFIMRGLPSGWMSGFLGGP